MNRLPNPFSSGQGNNRGTPKRLGQPSSPAFLLMTRPPTGSNSFGGSSYQSPSNSQESFIPFSKIGHEYSSNDSDNSFHTRNDGGKYGFHRGGGFGRGGSSGGGSAHRQGNYHSPRFAYPYNQSSSGRMSSPHNQDIGSNNSPNNYMRYSTPRGNYNSDSPGGHFRSGGRRGGFRLFGDFNKSNSNGNFRGGRGRGSARGPLSSIPIEKFITDSMVRDPWADLEKTFFCRDVEDKVSSASNPLEDSEIIIDSDLSTIAGHIVHEVISDAEVENSPVHESGSDSPNIATSSTSEKDTNSDSESEP